jgi:hypothetical protein
MLLAPIIVTLFQVLTQNGVSLLDNTAFGILGHATNFLWGTIAISGVFKLISSIVAQVSIKYRTLVDLTVDNL